MIAHSVDSRTGRIVGRLPMSRWEITEPVKGSTTSTVTVTIPEHRSAQARLAGMLLPRIRAVVLEDDDGTLLFGGPIPNRPPKPAQGVIPVPVVDWRAWFYRAPLRPTEANLRRNYIYRKSNQREQALLMTDLATIALEPDGAPAMVVDTAPTTGILRQFSTKMFQRSIGDALDDIAGQERGCEWHTYMATSPDPTVLLPHFKVSWPERRKRDVPLLLAYGGAVQEYTWPAGQDAPTKVWAVDGTDDVTLWQSAANPKIADGTELLWEQVITLSDANGNATKKAAFSQALGALEAASRLDGTAELTVTAERVPFGSVTVGDRARVVIDDPLNLVEVDVPAARIVQRVMSGGPGLPSLQVFTVDLANTRYPDDGATPGTPV